MSNELAIEACNKGFANEGSNIEWNTNMIIAVEAWIRLASGFLSSNLVKLRDTLMLSWGKEPLQEITVIGAWGKIILIMK